jgi:quercetin dioxygenase-like cupin family protein
MNSNYLPFFKKSKNSQAELQFTCVSNLYVRMSHFKKIGDIEESQEYKFDHICHLSKGKLKITVDEKSKIFNAPHLIVIRKNKVHLIEALEDHTTLLDIHAIRNGENVEDIIDPEDEIIAPGVNGVLTINDTEFNKYI